jgi:protease-4
MSNAAASGGYYISMNSERIFANPMTLTGSIGVFGIKFDASEFAKSYGVTCDYHPRGSHAAAENALTPLTPGMKENIARTVRDYYDYFKAIVATGRAMPVDDVEEVARGRVWTGEQAKEVGLVDSLGGLDRAVSYARRAYATTDRVEVDHYPRISSMWDVLLSSRGSSSYTDIFRASFAVMLGFGDGGGERGSVETLLDGLSELKFAKKPHFMVTMDEETAIDVIMKGDRL